MAAVQRLRKGAAFLFSAMRRAIAGTCDHGNGGLGKESCTTLPAGLSSGLCSDGNGTVDKPRTVASRRDCGDLPGTDTGSTLQAWHCQETGCTLRIPITTDQADSIGFCLAHHLIKHHGMTPQAATNAAPDRAADIEAYCKMMAVPR